MGYLMSLLHISDKIDAEFFNTEINYPASEESDMYRRSNVQATIFNFIIPYVSYLKEDNYWVQLHIMISSIAGTLRIK